MARRPHGVISRSVERAAAAACSDLDDVDSIGDGDEDFPLPWSDTTRSKRWAVHVSHVVRARLGGTPTRTVANKLMVQKMCRDYMKERGMRESHMPAHMPMAVTLTFVPTKYEIQARQLEASAEFAAREAESQVWGRRTGWFGVSRGLDYKKV